MAGGTVRLGGFGGTRACTSSVVALLEGKRAGKPGGRLGTRGIARD